MNEPENEEFDKLELSDDDEREDFSPLTPQSEQGMPKSVQQMVNQRLKETEKSNKSPPKEDSLMDGLSLGSESRNSKNDFNRTLGKKFANFKQLLDEEDLDGKQPQEKKIKENAGQASLTNQKAKLSLAQELGKLKTEYEDFSPDKTSGEQLQSTTLKAKSGLLISASQDDIETREDADDLSDESPEPRMENSQNPLSNLLKLQSSSEEDKNTTGSKALESTTEESKIKEANTNEQPNS